MKIKHLALLFFFCSLLPGCSYFGSKPDQAIQDEAAVRKLALKKHKSKPKTAMVGVEELETPRKGAKSSVEMTWEIPEIAVEGYIIRYGYAETDLSSQITVKVSELEKYEDPVHGFTYRYHLDQIDRDKPLFLTISAFSTGEESPPSRVYTVAPE